MQLKTAAAVKFSKIYRVAVQAAVRSRRYYFSLCFGDGVSVVVLCWTTQKASWLGSRGRLSRASGFFFGFFFLSVMHLLYHMRYEMQWSAATEKYQEN